MKSLQNQKDPDNKFELEINKSRLEFSHHQKEKDSITPFI